MNCTNYEARRERRGARSTSTSARSMCLGLSAPQTPMGRPTSFATWTARPSILRSSDAFKRLVTQSGLPRIRLHDLRHTHATLLLKAGVPIKVVSERLGHSTPGFTMATYQACSRRPRRPLPRYSNVQRVPCYERVRTFPRFSPVEHPEERGHGGLR